MPDCHITLCHAGGQRSKDESLDKTLRFSSRCASQVLSQQRYRGLKRLLKNNEAGYLIEKADRRT